MDILIIANYYESKGGISGVVRNHYRHLKKDGHKVFIFNTKRTPLVRLFLVIPLIFIIKDYSIVHIHGSSKFGFYPVILGIFVSKIIYNKRAIVTYHGGAADEFFQSYGKMIRWVLGRADSITVMSGFLQDIFYKNGLKTVILKNLIDQEVRLYEPVKFDKISLVSIRNLTKIYNVIDILFAYKLLIENSYEAELTIIGDGEEYKELVAFCRKENLINVTFLGFLHNDTIFNELTKHNIMISVPDFDNQPMSILEAFSVGIPVISSNVGGVPYMIEDFKTGFLVDLHKPEQIYERILWIMNNNELVANIINNARKEVSKYQWPEIGTQLYNLYEN